MRFSALLLGLALLLPAAAAGADEGTHVVGDGQTLGRIAKRYNLTIEELCRANGISRRDKIKPGQKLVIPSKNEASNAPEAKAAEPADGPEEKSEEKKDENPSLGGGLRLLSLPGGGKAYYFEPSGPGRQ